MRSVANEHPKVNVRSHSVKHHGSRIPVHDSEVTRSKLQGTMGAIGVRLVQVDPTFNAKLSLGAATGESQEP